MKNDPKSFVLCPYNAPLQPRRLIIAPAADGCKRMLCAVIAHIMSLGNCRP